MFKVLLPLAALMLASAPAMSQCTVTPIGGPGAAIAEEGSNPVVSGHWAYAGFTHGSKVSVLVATDDGAQLQPLQTIFKGEGGVKNLRLAAAGDNLYVVWLRKRGADVHLMFAANHDHGAPGAWDAGRDFGSVHLFLPQISADGDNVHLAYASPGKVVAVSSSADDGRTFTPPAVLDIASGEMVIASHGEDVYAAWESSRQNDPHIVELAASHDGGANFSTDLISDDGKRRAREPILSLAPNGGRLSLVWREEMPLQGIYLQSSDGAKSWTAPLAIDQPARQFMVQDTGRRIYVSYLKQLTVDGAADWQVFFTSSADGGQSFAAAQDLSGPSGIRHIVADDARPIPWAGSGKIRITGVLADGVHVWSGRNGVIDGENDLGAGILASPANRSALWLAPDGVVTFGYCP
ncbi:MAG: exo-alpha-sialidase [Alphaproteobacteria bacterium]|nr:exo-alpha-sialidase [Alphaproteobacteria bacterium]MBV9695036.1 exo-alpha-sialidase [Alphaproteobacteria bacterium]